MDSSDILKSLIIFIIFLSINVLIMLSIGLNHITDNWPLYKCNPVVMPFAKMFNHDPIQNFESCIKNIQNMHMGSLLDPVYFMMQTVSEIGDEIVQAVMGFSGILNLFKLNLGNIATMAIDAVINILIELQSILIKFKDMINKLVGIFVTIVYLIGGTQTTATTIWNGLPGWMLRAIIDFQKDVKL